MRAAYLGPSGHGQRRGADGGRAGRRGRAAGVAARCRAVGPGGPRASGRWRRSRTRSRAAWTRCSTRSRSRRPTSRWSARSSSRSPTAWPPGASCALSEITMVLSHPQALGQCRRWLAEHVPNAAPVPAASTADAVREVAGERDGTRAAIGPRLAARRYGAVMLAEDLEDDPGNATRFAWLARGRRRAAAAGRAARRRRCSCSGAPAPARRAGSCRAWPCSRSPA